MWVSSGPGTGGWNSGICALNLKAHIPRPLSKGYSRPIPGSGGKKAALFGKEMPCERAALARRAEESRDSVRLSLGIYSLKNDCSFLWPLEPEPEEVTFKASLFTPSSGKGPA